MSPSMPDSGCAAGVLTYNRTELASRTVRYLLEVERFPPEHVYVFVNGGGGLDRELERRVNLVRLPTNYGPAGGMKRAISHVALEGFEWMYLCEDDVGEILDQLPPRVVRVLGTARAQAELPAAVLAYGRSLDSRTGTTTPMVPGDELSHDGALVPCDVGAWGATLLNLAVIYPRLLPDETLWFGYEDFDFFLRISREGHPVLMDAQTSRQLGLTPHPSGRQLVYEGTRRIDDTDAWRRYYEARNFLPLARRYGTPLWTVSHLVKSMRRARHGGPHHWKAIAAGLYDGARDRRGPNPRYQRGVSACQTQTDR